MRTVAAEGQHGRIGPNAVIQLASALKSELGNKTTEQFFERSGYDALLFHPPAEMIDEKIPASLFDQLWNDIPDQAKSIAQEAGARTADYVIAYRIPRVVKVALRLLPKRVAAGMLLRAIKRNAWTFAGSGHCEVILGSHPMISIKDNPLVMPDCAWHTAVFQRLFRRLVNQRISVRHLPDRWEGDKECRFEINLDNTPGRSA